MGRPKTGSISPTPQGRWRVRWYSLSGQHPSRTFDSKHEAETFLSDVLRDQRHGIDIAVSEKTLRLKDLSDEWWAVVENSVKPRTAERYLSHLRIIEQHLGSLPLIALDYRRVQGFVTDLQRRYRPRTVTHTYAVLALMLKHGQRLGYIQKAVPKPVLPRITKPRLTIPTKEQVDRLAECSDARFHAAVLLAGYGGLRQGEVLALHRGDVHVSDSYILVHQARNKTTGAIESTKTDNARRVYMPARLSECVVEHLDEYDTELLFPATVSSFQKSWVRARKAAGVPTVRFHDLRHSAASLYIHAGWSPTQVAAQLGHADPAMTLRVYSHLWPQSYDDALRKIDEHLAHSNGPP